MHSASGLVGRRLQGQSEHREGGEQQGGDEASWAGGPGYGRPIMTGRRPSRRGGALCRSGAAGKRTQMGLVGYVVVDGGHRQVEDCRDLFHRLALRGPEQTLYSPAPRGGIPEPRAPARRALRRARNRRRRTRRRTASKNHVKGTIVISQSTSRSYLYVTIAPFKRRDAAAPCPACVFGGAIRGSTGDACEEVIVNVLKPLHCRRASHASQAC